MNTNVANNSKLIQDFLWAIAHRYAELAGETLADVKNLADIADFSFYGDLVVFNAPDMKRGVFNTAKEFADNNNCVFKAACADGSAWVLKLNNLISDSETKEAFQENIKIGGTTINKDAWKANRKYFKAI